MLSYGLLINAKESHMESCVRCGGTGKYKGIGFILTDCDLCIEEPEDEVSSLDNIDRKSKSYKKAIKDIMSINPEISRKEAIKMFDEAYIK